MRLIRTIRGLRHWRTDPKLRRRTIGFVPTMGSLHAGHQSLMRRARKTCDTLVVSLFVNPLQFGPMEDFHRYPRTLADDTALCRQEQVDILFIPSTQDMYPKGFQTSISVTQLSQPWEGQHRPSHFQGVGTVVTKLFNLVKPHTAFFGQKDYQQTLVIKQLVRDLSLDIKIVMCPTVREQDGLALSSRNAYLSSTQRTQAGTLYRALTAGKTAIHRGIRSGEHIQRIMYQEIAKNPEVTIDYLAVCDPITLEEQHAPIQGRIALLGAIRLGTIRLIDNLLVRPSHPPSGS